MTDVEEISGSPLGPEDRRRPYRLTALGATTLEAQLDGLAQFTRTGLERLGGSSG